MAIGFPVAIFVVMRIDLLVNCFSLIINILCKVLWINKLQFTFSVAICAFHHLRMRVQVPAA